MCQILRYAAVFLLALMQPKAVLAAGLGLGRKRKKV